MIPVVARHEIGTSGLLIELVQPRLAGALKPGQFVVAMVHAEGDRIPLVVADYDRQRGTVVVAIRVGAAPRALVAAAQPGGALSALLGPMGRPSICGGRTKVVLVGEGLGAAPLLPRARAWTATGTTVVTVLGVATRAEAFWTERFAALSDEVALVTVDGSGSAVDGLAWCLARHRDAELVVASGTLPTLRACANVTREAGVDLVVSVDPLTVAASGGCGSCGIVVAGRKHFTCVDGTDVDGHAVAFETGCDTRAAEHCRLLAVG